MCLIGLNWRPETPTPLILIANRDEFYKRPAKPLQRWSDLPHIYAGRDTEASGTWLGVSNKGRLAAVTNFREPSPDTGSKSRGQIPVDFLSSGASAALHIEQLAARANQYSGFNALFFDGKELWHCSNRSETFGRKLEPGIHGLSNHLLNTDWPKVRRLKTAMSGKEVDSENLFAVMRSKDLAAKEELPDTGVGQQMEHFLSPLFIQSAHYGTRATTLVRLDESLNMSIIEQSFGPMGADLGRVEMAVEADR